MHACTRRPIEERFQSRCVMCGTPSVCCSPRVNCTCKWRLPQTNRPQALGSPFQHPIPTAVQHAIMRSQTHAWDPGESPPIGLCARFLGPCPRSTQPTNPLIQLPPKRVRNLGSDTQSRTQKMRLQADVRFHMEKVVQVKNRQDVKEV